MCGQNKSGVNCFHKIFTKIGSRVKSFEKSTNLFSVQLDKSLILKFFTKIQLVVLSKQVVYTSRERTMLKTVYKRNDREIHTKRFILVQS